MSNMTASLLKIVFVMTLLCIVSGRNPDLGESDCLRVPAKKFAGTVMSTVATVRQVISAVSKISGAVRDFRLSNATYDCLDLMDITVDQLNAALSAAQISNGKDNSTGNLSGDINAWLSGALANQDTCKEGFDGTNALLKSLVSANLDQTSSLISNLLSMLSPNPTSSRGTGKSHRAGSGGDGNHSGGRKLITSSEKFPNWLKPHDRKLLDQDTNATVVADVVVASDGTGNFTRIGDAIWAAPDKSSKRHVIYVKKGVYKENVEISKKKLNIMMIGDGMDVTVISGYRNFEDGWTTYRTATFAVKGEGFIARDITFENTAGPGKNQAVAYRSDSDHSVLYRCAFKGYQDTLYAHSMRQFYRECKITGTVDFIFGHGACVFQNCQIIARKGLPNQKNTITAHGRKDPREQSGFSIQFCNISAEPDVLASSTPSYLGRPWKLYSRTVVMQSYISSAIRPEGWLEWNGNFALDTLFYGEYMNYGPGSGLGARVKWPGYHVLNDSAQAYEYTVARFIMGNNWLPSTGVRYTAGLTN